MKKVLLLLMLVLSLSIVGCANESTSGKGETDVNLNDGNKEAEEKPKKEEPEDEEIPIHPDELQSEIKLLDPDSIGNVYAEATFKNDTEYPITAYSLTMLKKDTNEKSYLDTYDTVMPGETSPTFQASGPNSQKDEDYEKLKLEVTAQLENGNELHIEYDFKLETAEWAEYE